MEVAGRIALPMICSAGRRLAVLATPPQTSNILGAEYGNCTRASGLHPTARNRARRVPRTGDPGYCFYTNSALLQKWSEQRELNSRHQLGRLRHQPLYHARFKPILAVATGVEPVPPDRQSGILHPATSNSNTHACRGPRPAARPWDRSFKSWLRGQDSNLHAPGQSR